MNPRQLIITLCITVVAAKSTALPKSNEFIVFREDSSEPANLVSRIYDVPLDTKITEMRVRSEIALRYACTSVVTHVRNPNSQPQEATFRMLLPDTAFISNFTMILGGISYKAYVKEKFEAEQVYNRSVAEGLSAAHVATEARDSNHFKVSVNVAGNSTAVFDLRYEEFLVRRNGLYNHAINLHPGGFVQKMEVVVRIKESQKISKLFVPEVRSGKEIDATEKDAQNSKAVIRRGNSKREVIVSFAPNLQEQERLAEIYERKSNEKNSEEKFIGYTSDEDEDEQEGTALGQFVVQYDVERSNNGEVLVNDGYFVHFLAPSSLPPLNKYVVFVLDTSGSMMGSKIDQLRSAMEAILSDLKPNDYFNIVEFNSVVTVHELKEADDAQSAWNNNYALVPPARATPENIDKAKIIVSDLDVSGVTDIHSALEMAFNLVRQEVPQENTTEVANTLTDSNGTDTNEEDVASVRKELERMVIFLTDGDANEGETSAARIVTSITRKNSGNKRAALYTLAFGEEANRVFLRELSLRNEGFMRQIYVAADAGLQLYDFYRQVSSPLLSHVQFQYPRRQIKEGSVSRTQFRTINEGSEVAVVGQIEEDVTEITPTVRGVRSAGDGIGRKTYKSNPRVVVNNTRDEHLPLERLWAYLTIRQLLDQREADDSYSTDENSPGRKALDIALKYSFVTPLTSLVVVKPDEKGAHEMRSPSVYAPHNLPIMAPVIPEATMHTVQRSPSSVDSVPTTSMFTGYRLDDLEPMDAMEPRSKHFHGMKNAVGPTIRLGGTGRTLRGYSHTSQAGSTSRSHEQFTAISDHSNPTGSVVLITSSRLGGRIFNGNGHRSYKARHRGEGHRLLTGGDEVPMDYSDNTLSKGYSYGLQDLRKDIVANGPSMISNKNTGVYEQSEGIMKAEKQGIRSEVILPGHRTISKQMITDECHRISGGNYYDDNGNLRVLFSNKGMSSQRGMVSGDKESGLIAAPEMNLSTIDDPVNLKKNEDSKENEQNEWNELLNGMGPSIMLRINGSRIYLKLADENNMKIPKAAGGDEECSNSVDENQLNDSVCVYITRCEAVEDMAEEEYLKSYCIVTHGYAGICCPRSLVD